MTPTQAIVRIVPRGGAKTAKQIYDQWMYLSRDGDQPLQRSARHMGLPVEKAALRPMAASWVMETGRVGPAADATQELTTHIIASFPPETPTATAFRIGRDWAEEMFGSGRNGGTFDYVTACHDDRPHPHVHLVVNRRALEGHWLKISRRHDHLSYDGLRGALVAVAARHGVALEATSRADRGITEPPVTYAEYRRRGRAAPPAPQP